MQPTHTTTKTDNVIFREYPSMHDLVGHWHQVGSHFERGEQHGRWYHGGCDAKTTESCLVSGLANPDADMDTFNQALRDFKRALGNSTAQSTVSGKRRKLRRKSGGRLLMNAYLNEDVKPFLLKSRKTAAPKLRVGFRSNGNSHMDAAAQSRTAALACAVANCLFQRGYAVEVSSLVASYMHTTGIWDVTATRLINAGTKMSSPRVLSCCTPAVHRVYAAGIRSVDHAGRGFGKARDIPSHITDRYFDVFINMDSTVQDITNQTLGLLGKIKSGLVTNK
ncbi:MAG: hypothetical protein Unbinned2706contig1001_16 [Prokaryotic dsDNA virus sp.]|nr:MAG: hypothetical protein Unbinned2706contig1001_16 [Prokaryotic dsDNA virus sp.]|tara:strand:- start:8399 stop:9235 length:837 start_codon:yes stop_codon:yes gene_type:complete